MFLKHIFWKNDKNTMKSLPESCVCSSDFLDRKQLEKGAPQCICGKGSLTIEAAIITPLLVSFFALFLFFFRMMQVQLVVQNALFHSARTLALYAGADDELSHAKYLALAKGMIVAGLSEDTNIKAYVSAGAIGISLAESEFDKNEIFLKANYQMKFPVELLGKRYMYLNQQVCCRKWTGWKETAKSDFKEDAYIYVTDTGSAYHKTKSCPYLDLTIRQVKDIDIKDLRNKTGGKYQGCTRCAEKNGESKNVYITSYGDYYHYSISCSGLKRTIYKIHIEKIGGRHKCPKCWSS